MNTECTIKTGNDSFFNNYGAIKRGSISAKWPKVRGWTLNLQATNDRQWGTSDKVFSQTRYKIQFYFRYLWLQLLSHSSSLTFYYWYTLIRNGKNINKIKVFGHATLNNIDTLWISNCHKFPYTICSLLSIYRQSILMATDNKLTNCLYTFMFYIFPISYIHLNWIAQKNPNCLENVQCLIS